MEIINRRQRMSSVARKIRREQDKTVGLVPTMGALHEGHLSLVREARRMCDIVLVSVFVNPTQFAPGEDFEKYPRDLTKDTALLTDYNVDYIFAPTVEEIYPKGFSTYVNVEGLSEQLEGASRPGHCRGVATVVTILLNTIRPDFAFFGQVTWVMFEVLAWAKLRRIHENRHHHHVAHSSRFTNQTQVSFVKSAHRRNQSHSLILFTTDFARDGTHALTAIDDFHRIEDGLGLLRL